MEEVKDDVSKGYRQSPTKSKSASLSVSGMVTSQLEGPSPANSCGFKINQSVLCSSHDIHQVRMCAYMHHNNGLFSSLYLNPV